MLAERRRAVMSSGLPAIAYTTKKSCGQRMSAGAGGGYYTAAGIFSICFAEFVVHFLLKIILRPTAEYLLLNFVSSLVTKALISPHVN